MLFHTVGLALCLWSPACSVEAKGGCSPALLARARKTLVFAPWAGGGLLEGAPEYRAQVIFSGDQEAKAHSRQEVRYRGAMPSEAELRCFLENGLARAFFRQLEDSRHKKVVEDLRDIEAELGRLAHELDLEVQRAKLVAKGTADKVVIRRADADRERRRTELQERQKTASPDKVIWIETDGEKQNVWHRISRDDFPRVFDLRDSEIQTYRLRERLLEERLLSMLQQEGLAALSPGRFDQR